MAKTKTEAPEAPKNALVQAPEGKGFFLTNQNVYVATRPFVVSNDGQVQSAISRSCLVSLGTTNMSDEAFFKAFSEDAEKAISKAVGKAADVDEGAVASSKALAAKTARKAAANADAEKARLEKEKATRVEAEKAHQAELAAAAKAKAEA